ncbi:MAG: 30S ribosomal protein S18 [Candidatus Omnitrophica bacterium]|nr:30S ribosomal protein S18 [Candidatus Omnitrophota bacterium]
MSASLHKQSAHLRRVKLYQQNRRSTTRGRGDKKDNKRRFRPRMSPRFQVPEKMDIDYKNVSLLQKFISDRGKIVPRRISSVSAKDQRKLSSAIKMARYLGLLTSGRADLR